MKRLIILLMLTVGTGSYYQSQAQFINRLKKAVQKKVEDKTIETAEKGIDKGFDKGEEALWESMQKKQNQGHETDGDEEGGDDAMTGDPGDPDMSVLQEKYMKMMGGGAPVEVADAYTFTKKVRYHVISDAKEQKGSMDYILWLNPEKGYTGWQLSNFKDESGINDSGDRSVITILDNEREAMIMLMPEKKMATVISTTVPEGMGDNTVQGEGTGGEKDVTIKKTGRTKEILGYPCEEFEVITPESHSNVWVTKELEAYNSALFKGMRESPLSMDNAFKEMQGMMMEMIAVTKEGKTGDKVTVTMKAVEIGDEPVTFNMSEYQKMNVGGAPADK